MAHAKYFISLALEHVPQGGPNAPQSRCTARQYIRISHLCCSVRSKLNVCCACGPLLMVTDKIPQPEQSSRKSGFCHVSILQQDPERHPLLVRTVAVVVAANLRCRAENWKIGLHVPPSVNCCRTPKWCLKTSSLIRRRLFLLDSVFAAHRAIQCCMLFEALSRRTGGGPSHNIGSAHCLSSSSS